MSAQAGWLERLLDWAVGASREDRLRYSGDEVARLVPAREPESDERTHRARSDYEREIELRILMSTWM